LEQATAKATPYVKTDVEGRRLGTPTGLDTPAVLAENDECHRLELNIFF
jgi:hypothetical protein